ncbi:MAG: hypothetical protein O7E54_01200, partial [Planctomycetota bacterium]|nr:hypothetical protein [Planctomycetota bacterium]
YTGDFDRYALQAPDAGRMQVALTWQHDADFDLILARDAEGEERIAEGLLDDNQPEYVGLSVQKDDFIYIFVLGWEGDPGEYKLEVLVLPDTEPVFDIAIVPNTSRAWPGNRPIAFTFNVDLDPAQDVTDTLAFVAPGVPARGNWCIAGPNLLFMPEFPQQPGDSGGLKETETYTIQFRRGGKGLRAATGEYLSTLVSGEILVGPYEDESESQPPRVIAIDRNLTDPWDGAPITFFVNAALAPETVGAQIMLVDPSGGETPFPTRVHLQQEHNCTGIDARIIVEPDGTLPSGQTVRIVIAGTVLGISGDPSLSNGLTGPEPDPGGQGIALDFTSS